MSKFEGFKKGDRVHVGYDGTVLGDHDANSRWVWIRPENHSQPYLVDSVHVAKLDPDNWPPQVGDVWETKRGEWAALAYGNGGSGYVMMANVDDYVQENITIGQLKEKNPILVRRRDTNV